MSAFYQQSSGHCSSETGKASGLIPSFSLAFFPFFGHELFLPDDWADWTGSPVELASTFFFGLFWGATSVAYGGSQPRGQVGAVAAFFNVPRMFWWVVEGLRHQSAGRAPVCHLQSLRQAT